MGGGASTPLQPSSDDPIYLSVPVFDSSSDVLASESLHLDTVISVREARELMAAGAGNNPASAASQTFDALGFAIYRAPNSVRLSRSVSTADYDQ